MSTNSHHSATVGDMPLSQQPSRAPANRVSKKIERSCAICHRRKVRCDKKLPCSTCVRTGVLCCYPSSDRVTPRQPKATIADIASRLVQLERTIVAVSGDLAMKDPIANTSSRSQTPGHPDSDDMSISGNEDTQSATMRDELLVHNEFSTRYINEILLSRVLEEEREMQSALTTPRDTTTNDEGGPLPTFSLLSMVSGNNQGYMPSNFDDLHPPTWQAMQLWQIFVQNVDPMNKILHIPTAQVTVYTAINNISEASPAVCCLLFSIYFSAITSQPPEETKALLGKDKTKALNEFRFGLETSLAKANFLENPSLVTLQALGLFLRTIRAHNTGRSVWILWGLVIRAAQSIGLHRDGSKFNLPPFEAELRRRLWCHMLVHDCRSAEDHGLAVEGVHDPTTDTRFPLNVNDTDLDPSMHELPQASEGWTEMTLPLLMFEISFCSQRLYRMLASASHGGTLPSEAKRVEIIDKQTQRTESFIRRCNPVIPIQRATAIMLRVVLRKISFVTRLQWLTARQESAERSSHATEENLVDATEVLELSTSILTDDFLRNYRWSGETYPQFHMLMYVLWHLCVKPVGGSVDRAWAAVDSSFKRERLRQERQNISDMGRPAGSKWAALTLLREKALRIREAVLRGDAREVPLSPSTEIAEGQPEDTATVPLPEGFEQTMAWDNGFLDWDTFVEDFKSSSGGFEFGNN